MRRLVREILYPLTELSVLFALLTFLLLGLLAEAAGLLGIWLAIVIIPAYFRYLLYLLDARANGRDAPTPGIELFNWVDNFWSLFPLALFCLLIWGEILMLERFSSPVAIVPALLPALLPARFAVVLYPASMAVLAMTRSPLQSLNPVALLRVVRACGADYLLVPLLVTAVLLLLLYLADQGAPRLLLQALAMYASFLFFTMTGAVIRANAGAIPIDLPTDPDPDPERLEAEQTRDRTTVLNHAYGFVSRGNRQGGLRHISEWIQGEPDIDLAYRWFIEQMMQWESTDAALSLAQSYLSRLLAQQREIEALKLIHRCLLENDSFMPLPQDRARALAAAERKGHDELRRYLRN